MRPLSQDIVRKTISDNPFETTVALALVALEIDNSPNLAAIGRYTRSIGYTRLTSLIAMRYFLSKRGVKVRAIGPFNTEAFCQEQAYFERFMRQYDTGAPVPSDVVQRQNEARDLWPKLKSHARFSYAFNETRREDLAEALGENTVVLTVLQNRRHQLSRALHMTTGGSRAWVRTIEAYYGEASEIRNEQLTQLVSRWHTGYGLIAVSI